MMKDNAWDVVGYGWGRGIYDNDAPHDMSQGCMKTAIEIGRDYWDNTTNFRLRNGQIIRVRYKR